MTTKQARVYRFGDCVALAVPGSAKTVYLSKVEAFEIAKALADCGWNLDDYPSFANSTFGTREIAIAPNSEDWR